MSSNAVTQIDQLISIPRAVFNLDVEPRRSLETALKEIFPGKQEDALLKLARRTMGGSVAKLSDRELEVYITKFQYLIDCWMDEFEKDIFDGLTLKQVIMEG